MQKNVLFLLHLRHTLSLYMLCRGEKDNKKRRSLRSPSIWMGLPGLEPGTSVLSGLRSRQLSYRPAGAVQATWATGE